MLRTVARQTLTQLGWVVANEPPQLPKYVLIAAPHTSNWDFPLMLTVMAAHGVPLTWVGKHDIFWGPFGPLLRLMGGIPVNRSHRNGIVSQSVRAFRTRERMVLAIPPEGTRSRTTHWKSGFYRVAHIARVPLVPGYADYGDRTIGFGPPLNTTGDVRADMEVLRNFYEPRVPLHPERFGPVQLHDEQTDDKESSGEPLNSKSP